MTRKIYSVNLFRNINGLGHHFFHRLRSEQCPQEQAELNRPARLLRSSGPNVLRSTAMFSVSKSANPHFRTDRTRHT